MNSMVCLGHFCEQHGPTAVLTTQQLPERSAVADVPGVDAQRQQTCAACRLELPVSSASGRVPACLRTAGGRRGTCFVSSRYPGSPARFLAVRQACLRALSAEHVFDDRTPMLFSDSKVGAAAVLVFHVDDGASRGRVRKYALVCLAEAETQLAHAWGALVPQLIDLAGSIKSRARAAADRNAGAAGSAAGNERFLRVRDTRAPPRGLPAILADDHIFLEIHARFAKILALLADN